MTHQRCVRVQASQPLVFLIFIALGVPARQSLPLREMQHAHAPLRWPMEKGRCDRLLTSEECAVVASLAAKVRECALDFLFALQRDDPLSALQNDRAHSHTFAHTTLSA